MLDGLANDAGFYRRVILRGDLHGYLEQEHIDLISWGGCSEGPPGWAVPDELRPSIERTWGLAAAITGRVADGGCRGVMVWGRR
jgi:hypothetical protein